uniref:Uncharacterized protein n=1 Tax=Rhizophora mucronata TaxID=61149 RepID=A0A2P2NUQ0_RHIMU
MRKKRIRDTSITFHVEQEDRLFFSFFIAKAEDIIVAGFFSPGNG